MAAVTAIAGFLLRAEAPHILASWYAEVLQVELHAEDDEGFFGELITPSGKLQIAIVPREADRAGLAPSRMALTFQVEDLEAFLAHLDTLGIEPDAEFEHEGQGRFLYLRDLEGNPLAFWGA